MSKRFKLKFPSMNIPSFQFCRLKSPNSLPRNPKPANYRRSPVNPKASDISFPSLLPATPEYTFVSRRASSSSSSSKSTTKIRSSSSNGCDHSCRSKSCGVPRRTGFPGRCTVETTTLEENHFVKERKSKKKPIRSSHALALVGSDEDDDSLVLLDSSRSFSSEQYPTTASRAVERREAIGSETTSSARESVAVVKNSEDPYEDFKRSMLEMIMEKQMFEATDLEELLQCFLTLNSRQYHGLIVEAFSEIWEILFSDNSHAKYRLSF